MTKPDILKEIDHHYFWDVDLSDWPVLIKEPELAWSQVKKRIEKAVLEYTRETS